MPEVFLTPLERHVVEMEWFELLQTSMGDTKVDWSRKSDGFTAERVSHKFVDCVKDPWYGTNSHADAVDLARYGWVEGAQLLERFSDAAYENLASLVILPTIRYAEVPGMDVDIERYLEGEPACWRETVDVSHEGPGRAVRLVYNLAASAAVATRTLMAKGAAVAGLVSLLELSGQRTEVIVTYVVDVGSKAFELNVKLKAADETADPSALAFGLAHPAMGRRLMLAVLESLPEEIRTGTQLSPGSTYGYPGEASDQGDIYIGSSTYGDVRWKDEQSAARWVVKMLAEQGVSLKDDAGEYLEVGS